MIPPPHVGSLPPNTNGGGDEGVTKRRGGEQREVEDREEEKRERWRTERGPWDNRRQLLELNGQNSENKVRIP